HRVDATRVTGAELELTADHDGRIVADVVAEWARRHGQPFDLSLTGPAGGNYTVPVQGDGTPESLQFDAVEFCRILAGRAEANGLMTTIVPF
ncbi:MAG: maleylpyruvate isomerase family mycothiol-dependent enzyme, partial [Acidimicrobiales bacterium]